MVPPLASLDLLQLMLPLHLILLLIMGTDRLPDTLLFKGGIFVQVQHTWAAPEAACLPSINARPVL
jgi:hypothetical protein